MQHPRPLLQAHQYIWLHQIYWTPLFLKPGSAPADDAFPLREYLLKQFPHRSLEVDKRVYNYRLSRARRVVENAFGILANRFRIFLTPIALPPATVEQIVLAACSLHNMLRTEVGPAYFGALADRVDPVPVM